MRLPERGGICRHHRSERKIASGSRGHAASGSSLLLLLLLLLFLLLLLPLLLRSIDQRLMTSVWGAWLMSRRQYTRLSLETSLLLDCGSGSVFALGCLRKRGCCILLASDDEPLKLAHEAPPHTRKSQASSCGVWNFNTHTAQHRGITQTHGLRCCAVASMPLFSGAYSMRRGR